ncbi:hypothetical protein Tco_0255640 [Tanacetum coccineum]
MFTDLVNFLDMEPLPAADQRHPWFRYLIEEYNEGIRHRSGSETEDGVFWRGATGVHESCLKETIWIRHFGQRVYLEFSALAGMSDTEMGLDVTDTLCFQLGGVRRRMTWSQFILALGLHTKQEMVEAGFGAYLDGSDRLIPDKGDLRDYWIEISSDRDFLGPAPSYVLIRDLVRRLCHMMITYVYFGRGQAPEMVSSIVLDDTPREALSWEPTVSPLNDNKIDFRISFDESDDKDYTPEVSYSNDLGFFKDFENEFPAIAYNDALTSKSDFLTEPTISP